MRKCGNKVEAAIAQLDYVPSAVARSLKAKTTATIGLLIPNSLNPYFAELARGIEDYCERNGYLRDPLQLRRQPGQAAQLLARAAGEAR